MEKEIGLGQVTGIEVVFENVEVIYIPEAYLHKLEVKGINRTLYLDKDYKSVRKTVNADWVDFVVREYEDTAELLEASCNFAPDEYSCYKRVMESQDIVCISCHLKDGSKEEIYVDYQEDGWYYAPNENQSNRPIISEDVSSGVHIRIASPKTTAKVLEERNNKAVQSI